ncbi:MAG: M15 family metallopeptidase [Porcipelethomonas sp.]
MSNNRYRRRPRVRYDRVIGVAAIFIVLIILLVSCCKSCGNDDDKSSGTNSSIVPTEDKNEKKDENSDKSSDDSGADDESQTDLSFSSISAMPNETSKGDLILVNSDHPFEAPVGENDNEIVTIYDHMTDSYMAKDYEITLGKKTILAVNNLMDAFYNETGYSNLMVVSGYRTKEEQDAEFESGSSEIKGGCSDYNTGLGFSLSVWGDSPYYYVNSGDYAWIAENCAKYGIITRYPEGKEDKTGIEGKQYQFRYVGIPHAVYMYDNKLCLEEYLSEIKNYTADGEHLKVTANEKKYEIYYVAQDPSANTEIPVPTDKTYTVSGNNTDGFIVTVEI